jgi:membrane protease YdiL (CAAX protease family)
MAGPFALPGAEPVGLSGPVDSHLRRSPLEFFGLVLTLSVPFWMIGAATNRQLMPGLSVSALMAFCPMTAALILVHRERGIARVKQLLKRSFDCRRIKALVWLLPLLLLMPGVSFVVYGLMRWTDMPVPVMQLAIANSLWMLLAFFIGALGEELGWSGYILEPLQERWHALQASLILGGVGVAWHLVPLLLVHRPLAWIAWWCLYAMAARLLTVWLYNNTGRSVFAASVFHATLNLTYMLFPVYGSHFDMRIGGLVMAGVAVLVVVVWGPKSLTRIRRS